MSDRPLLHADALDETWGRVRARLEAQGVDNRGRITLPPLGAPARLTLTSLLGRPPGRTLSLAALEQALVALDLGPGLAEALARLGHPVSDEPARRRRERAEAAEARAQARRAAADWPEPWAPEWMDEVIRAGVMRGFDPDQAVTFVATVRRVLDHLVSPGTVASPPSGSRSATTPGRPSAGSTAAGQAAGRSGLPGPTAGRTSEVPRRGTADGPGPSRAAAHTVGRVDLAAQLLGSAHALDPGTRLEAALTRALAQVFGPAGARRLWEQAGVHLDLTSGPVLTWALRPGPDHPLAPLLAAATEAGMPLHLTRFALRRHPIAVAPGARVLVVENPRLVEAAAQAGLDRPVVATNGNPSAAGQLLIEQLLSSGAEVDYHGDFDAAGLAICARMAAAGLRPWRMEVDDYRAAVFQAGADGVELPIDPNPCGPTPWDPQLQVEFDRTRRIVHEERLLPALLTG